MTISHQEKELIECLFCGDKRAWERFVREYSPVVWSAVNKTFRQYGFPYRPEDAEDVYCMVFLALLEKDHRKLRGYAASPQCSFTTFLTVVTVHRTIDFLRKERFRTFTDSCADDGADDRAHNIPDTSPLAADLIAEEQRTVVLQKAIQSLPAAERQLYGFLFEEVLSPADIAQRLNVSIPAVYVKKNRLMEKIKKSVKYFGGAYV